MALVDLALHDHTGPVTLPTIAERQKLPIQYLEQLFPKLRRVGLVESVRGAKGGYTLARPSTQIMISDVILAVEDSIQTTRCQPGSSIGCQGKETKCLTHALWLGLREHILSYLENISLDQICKNNIPRKKERLAE